MDENKNKVLLMEIIVVLLFFSVSAVTTLQLFARASMIAHRSGAEARVLIRCEDLAERLKACEDPMELLDEDGSWQAVERTPDGFSARMALNSRMEPAQEGEVSYYIAVSGVREREAGGALWEMRVAALDAQGEKKIELPVVRYDGKEEARP